MVDRVVVEAPLIHEGVVVDLSFGAEVVAEVGQTFGAEEEAVLVEALVAVGNRGGKLPTCNYLSECLLLIQCLFQYLPIRCTCQHRRSFN